MDIIEPILILSKFMRESFGNFAALLSIAVFSAMIAIFIKIFCKKISQREGFWKSFIFTPFACYAVIQVNNFLDMTTQEILLSILIIIIPTAFIVYSDIKRKISGKKPLAYNWKIGFGIFTTYISFSFLLWSLR